MENRSSSAGKQQDRRTTLVGAPEKRPVRGYRTVQEILLTSSLLGILMRFCQESVALMRDVEAMFHQVQVKSGECSALCFLWWPNGDLDLEPEEHMMTVH